MFGNKPTTGLFGSNANTSFGGGSAFGAASTPFGGNTGGFGAGGFGTSTPAAGGGLFGSTNTAAPAAGGLFGNTNTSFGAPNVATPFSFGNAAASVQPTVQQPTGLFGNAASSGFGTNTSSLFGQPAQQQPAAGAFGAASGTTGLFGNTGSSFMSSTPSSGTTVKFVPATGTDVMMKGGSSQNVNTKLQCITGMKEYENKSLEELRLEDYLANRKSGAIASSGLGVGGFLGSTAQPAQSSAFGLFGAPQTSKPSFAGFGTSTSSSGSLFGGSSLSQAKPLFGGTTTTTAAASPFGTGLGNTTSLFGNNSMKPGGLFGSTATSQPSTGLFGAVQPTPTSGFGATAFGATASQPGTGLFGAQKVTGFGTAVSGPSTGFGGFGTGTAQQPAASAFGTGLFGAAKPATTMAGFGFNQPSTGLGFGFGGPTTSTALGNTSAFGSGLGTLGTGTGSSLFSSTLNKPATLNFGNTSGFGMLNTTNNLNLGTNNMLGSSNLGTAQNDVSAALAQQQQQLQQQLQVLSSSPYGDSPLFRNLKRDPAKQDELLKPTNPAAQKATLTNGSQLKVSSRPMLKIRPKPLQSIVGGKAQLFDGLEEDDGSFETDTFVPRRNYKRLSIKGTNREPSSGAQSVDGDNFNATNDSFNFRNNENVAPEQNNRDSMITNLNIQPAKPRRDNATLDSSEIDNTMQVLNPRAQLRNDRLQPNDPQQNESSSERDDANSNFESDAPPHPAGIVLRRPDYGTVPDFIELTDLIDDNGQCIVEDFVVYRENYGSVFFPGKTNITGINFDEIVHFRRKEIDIYPNENVKPPLGEGLNKKAQVTLDRVWPVDKTTGEDITDYDRLVKMSYNEHLEKATRKINAKFIDYRPDTGSWVFEVKHFSKYGLLDDSDDESMDSSTAGDLALAAKAREQLQQQQQQQQQQLQLQQQQKLQLLQQQQQQQLQQMSHLSQLQGIEEQHMLSQRQELVPSGGLGGRQFLKDTEDSDMQEDDFLVSRFPEQVVDIDLCEEDGDISSMHTFAKHLGVSAKHVQLQKASFFADDDEDMDYHTSKRDWGQPAKQSFIGRSDKSIGLFSDSLKPAKVQFSPGSGSHTSIFAPKTKLPDQISTHPLLPSGMTEERRRTRPVSAPGARQNVVRLEDSLMFNKQSLLMDVGLVQGKRSRVGWSTAWDLVHVGPSVMTDENDDESDASVNRSMFMHVDSASKSAMSTISKVIRERINFPDESGQLESNQQFLKDCLETELYNSEMDEEYGCPIFAPSRNGKELMEAYADKAKSHVDRSDLAKALSTTWNLCTALWGESSTDGRLREDSYACQQHRREALSNWLTENARPMIEDEIQKLSEKGHPQNGSSTLSFLMGRLIQSACEEALASRDFHMALLITQAIGCDETRVLLQKQLAMWADTKMDQFIEESRLATVALLAGILVLRTSEKQINTCSNLDWKRSFALHLWYHCSAGASISEALQEYEKAYDGSSTHGQYAAPPLPDYMERFGFGDKDVQDVRYHILKLFCDRTHPLHVLLDPATMSCNQLDYSQSWHLMQVLEGLGYSHLSDIHHAAVCTSYASQLETAGLWHWAAFVLLHLRQPISRMDAVKKLLMQHVWVTTDLDGDRTEELESKEMERENFLTDRLRIPSEWINEAKAIKAGFYGDHKKEAWFLLKAQKWNQCHSVVIEKIASEAVVNEDYDLLCAYLKPMADNSDSLYQIDWKTGGQVYLEHIDMLDMLQDIMSEDDPSEYKLESLHSITSSLSSKLKFLPSNTALDRLSQSTMSKTVSKAMSVLMSKDPGQRYLCFSAEQLSMLPMPEDTALEALSQMSHKLLQTMLQTH